MWVSERWVGVTHLCQVCDMLLALLTQLSPLGKSLLSQVCSLSCCCSNLQSGASASYSAAKLLPTHVVECFVRYAEQNQYHRRANSVLLLGIAVCRPDLRDTCNLLL